MVIFGVHRAAWSNVSEVELLTESLVVAEDHAKAQSATWPYGVVAVTSRVLEQANELRVMSVWKRGEKVADHGPRGEWRKVKVSPI
jgi:hypothetical protein